MPFEIMRAPGEAIVRLDELSSELPLLVSPKLDGIRCLVRNGCALSSHMKPIQNAFIRTWLESRAELLDGLEGELTLSTIRPFREVTSAVMSRGGEPDFVFNVFDSFTLFRVPMLKRIEHISNRVWLESLSPTVTVVVHRLAKTVSELEELHAHNVAVGYEGSMVKSPHAAYVNGRMTMRNTCVWKVKQKERTEATVVGVERRKTPVHQRDHDGKMIGERDVVYHDEVGALRCRFDDGAEFKVGSGFSQDERVSLWSTELIGRRCVVEHQLPRVAGESPRFPTFQGWSDS